MSSFAPIIRPAVVLFLGLSLITGVAYPLAITGVAQVAFPQKANGSLIFGNDGKPIASKLIGQEFAAGDPKDTAKWFWGRPSATGPVPDTALNLEKGTGSSGSNLAPSNPVLLDNVRGRIDALNAADAAVGLVRGLRAAGVNGPGAGARGIPIDLVTASASGLDPHISPAAAEYQVPRVAKARGMSEDSLREAVRRHTIDRALGVLGEPVVNVVELNLELEAVPSKAK